MIILGIETSCDDTGVAILKASPTRKAVRAGFNILSNIVSSQIKTHAPYGGVVPNLAAREHLKNIEPCLKQTFKEAKIKPKEIDLIAVTIGPGLIPSLLIGTNFAKTLAYVWKKPIIGVNHIEAHILASIFNFQFSISNKFSNDSIFKQLFPAIALVVSGGHTQLVLVKKIGDYKIIGETRDDAAGECFDKVAKLLRLGYPGGPIVAKMATKIKNPAEGEARQGRQKSKIKNIELPRPMITQKNYDFSFSGLKTAVLYLLKDLKQKYPIFCDREKKEIITQQICAEVQQAIIDVLIDKTLRAAKEYKAKTIILSGGVAANKELRKQFQSNIHNLSSNIQFLVPPMALCTDNGVMIAMAGYYNYKAGKSTRWQKIKANANLRIG